MDQRYKILLQRVSIHATICEVLLKGLLAYPMATWRVSVVDPILRTKLMDFCIESCGNMGDLGKITDTVLASCTETVASPPRGPSPLTQARTERGGASLLMGEGPPPRDE